MHLHLDRSAGQLGQFMVRLELAGEPVGEISLDPEGQTVTDLDIIDPETFRSPPDRLEQGLASLARPPKAANLAKIV
jgi:hypothetical protein